MENESDPLQKYRQAFQSLFPNGEGIIHRDTLKNFLANTLGSHFDEQVANNMIDTMKPDNDGMISVDGFMEAFSQNHWPPETLAIVADFLESSPDLVKRPGDWMTLMANFGLNINEEDVYQLIGQARKNAADLFRLQLKEQPQLNKSEVGVRRSEVLDALQGKLHELEIGAGVALPQNCPEEEPPSESGD